MPRVGSGYEIIDVQQRFVSEASKGQQQQNASGKRPDVCPGFLCSRGRGQAGQIGGNGQNRQMGKKGKKDGREWERVDLACTAGLVLLYSIDQASRQPQAAVTLRNEGSVGERLFIRASQSCMSVT